ncbi:protein NUCLEAR FUSION DEFECTIVE 6, chloroplastic/mitochondrial-like [Quillaja saponaria]|uniref:Protein NUCLEAR FUSION DEFECTIVE 6, chloroplastic/mitochondrial-like n=1 Tax=Quillaja saponaria TaxID=32244 RepID=A0AAD7LZS3_QUISA|nr:protein NUCLEAR FUSION DEFECTIVE 6, chloroplastic/mitochondrial-like [Quillaja saponaria]
MAFALCRSAVMASSRSLATRSSTLTQRTLNQTSLPSMFSSSSSKAISRASRILSVLGSVESMMPLHSAIASTRLTSNIAVNSSCWSLLSQGLPMPL